MKKVLSFPFFSLRSFVLVASCLAFVACADDSADEPAAAADVDEDAGSDVEEEEVTVGAACLTDVDCGDALVCDTSTGLCVACLSGETRCEGAEVLTCLPDGSAFGNAVSCDDGNSCTVGDSCLAGACVAGEPLDCDNGDPCNYGACDPASGECLYYPTSAAGCCAADADCDDGLDCTTDTCETVNGVCGNLGGPCVELSAEWGEKGEADGQLSSPRGIAVLLSGEVVVSDTGNNRLSLFSPEGVFIKHFGEPTNQDALLSQPSGLAVFPDGRIAVADTGNDRVAIFSSDGVFLTAMDGDMEDDDSELEGPSGVLVAQDGVSLWVANTSQDTVVKLGADGLLQETYGGTGDSDGKFRRPLRMALDKAGQLYVTDSETQRVTILNPEDGKPTLLFGTEGVALGEFTFPTGIVITQSDFIAIADSGNSRLQFFRGCTPFCSPIAECGANGCGGSCGQCVGEGASCVEGLCEGPLLGGDGCLPNESQLPSCLGCPCEECVCGLDPFCCDTMWDALCAGACANECGAVCAAGEPEIDPLVTAQSEWADGSLAPTDLAIGPDGRIWVIHNVQALVRSYKVTP